MADSLNLLASKVDHLLMLLPSFVIHFLVAESSAVHHSKAFPCRLIHKFSLTKEAPLTTAMSLAGSVSEKIYITEIDFFLGMLKC